MIGDSQTREIVGYELNTKTWRRERKQSPVVFQDDEALNLELGEDVAKVLKFEDQQRVNEVTFHDGITSMQSRVHVDVERIKLQCEKTNGTLDARNFRYTAVHYIQQKLIAGHIEAINQAYEKNFEKGETIDVPSMNENMTKTQLVVKNYRDTFTLSKQSSLFTAR